MFYRNLTGIYVHLCVSILQVPNGIHIDIQHGDGYRTASGYVYARWYQEPTEKNVTNRYSNSSGTEKNKNMPTKNYCRDVIFCKNTKQATSVSLRWGSSQLKEEEEKVFG